MQTKDAVREVKRVPSPIPLPQALAIADGSFWMSSREVPTLYQINPSDWSIVQSVPAPGWIWGLASGPMGLAAVCGIGADDDRYLYHYDFESGFRGEHHALPDFTGAYLAYDQAAQLYLTQWYKKRVIQLDDAGQAVNSVATPHELSGICRVDDAFYLLGTDTEHSDDYILSRLTLGSADPVIEDVSRVAFPGRSLAFDGTLFWSNHRAAHEIVALELPR